MYIIAVRPGKTSRKRKRKDNMEIKKDDYQPEEKTSFDFRLTHEEKMQLAFYIFLILLGLGLLFGLFKSGEIVSHQQAVVNLSNLTNETVRNLTGQI